LGDQAVHLTESVLFVSESVVGRHKRLHGLGGNSELHLAERELVTVGAAVERLSELVDSGDLEDAAVSVDVGVRSDLVTGEVVVTDEVLAWLVHVKSVGQLLSTEEKSEGVSSVVGVMALTDLECVVSQIVVHHVGKVLVVDEEAEDLAVVIQELLLRSNLATTETLLQEVSHLGVCHAGHGDLRHHEVVAGRLGCRRQISSLSLYKAFES
jgi:hypothetical protein